MGEHGDILRTMHNALREQQRELVLEAEPAAPIIGRIASKGLVDELNIECPDPTRSRQC